MSVSAQSFKSDVPTIDLEADGGDVLDQFIMPNVLPVMIPVDSKLLLPELDAVHPNGRSTSVCYLLAPTTDTEHWRGAVGEVSLDGGTEFVQVAENVTIPVLGVVTKAPPAPAADHLIQEDESFRVRLTTGNTSDLAAVTYDELLSGRNSALLGSPELGWEVVQFKDVALLDGGEYELSYLVRGRRGTADVSGASAAGVYFILLSGTWIDASDLPLANVGTTVEYRATERGAPVHSSYVHSFQFVGESAKPLAPVHVEVEWSGADLDVSFIRQTRGRAPWQDGSEDVSLVEAAENFRVTLYTDGTFGTAGSTADLDDTDKASGRYVTTVTAATLNTVYGTSTPATVYVGVKQYSDYLAAYGDERLTAIPTGA
jgi:hypothetical protein